MELSAWKEAASAMGFVPRDGSVGVYEKAYPAHGGYTIALDFNSGKILYDYPVSDAPMSSGAEGLRVYRHTSDNFAKPENLSVLDCVNRLLEKGYPPCRIELEKPYSSGRGDIWLDVLVKDQNDRPYLMLECKTWGAEFEREQRKMLKDGGQLLSYYANDRDARYLCLYAARLTDGGMTYQCAIADVEPEWKPLSGVKEIHERWNKTFRDNGVFECFAAPYGISHRTLTYSDLQPLREEDSGKIFNQIMEILRHNAISDKPNAFNKLLNLFVCKIIDEDRNPDDEMDFQWREDDTDERMQLRLNDLYKEGMWRFLEIRVIDYEQREVQEKLRELRTLHADKKLEDWIWKMYEDTRLKKSPNFAFVEVQDERTFQLNAKVLREIVVLLQGYKFRYEQKHEFLGNFFEQLLNTSMKQEAGQFFTPVPVTRFILRSLPLREWVQARVDSRQPAPLPAVIDFACGSGHFLTEYMEQMQEIIDSQINTDRASRTVRNLFQSWKGFTKFLWARDTVYGIDLDNRLVKTTKVSAFFNGDGEANVVWANGLENFEKSEAYRGLLKRTSNLDRRENGQFDLLISNPPYSVDSFRNTIQWGADSFELYQYLTDRSSEIECLFVERMKQLLKVGGRAAIILPSSILSNGGIYARSREILFQSFFVRAIVELGPGTFMKTNTNTVVLFLERRPDSDSANIRREINRFFSTGADTAAAGLERAFSTFVSAVYPGLTLADYRTLFQDQPSPAMAAHELYTDAVQTWGEAYREKAAAMEKEKMLYFLLTHRQNIVVVKAGTKKEEKRFLGYEFSERRGHEGLHSLPGGTMLYDDADPLNPQKASSYIYRAFLGQEAEVDESLKKHVSYGRMSGFFVYGTSRFDKAVNMGRKPQAVYAFPMKRLDELVYSFPGVTYGKGDQVYEETNNRVLTADTITQDGRFVLSKTIWLRADLELDEKKRLRADDVFMCFSSGSRSHVGKCAYIEEDLPCYAGGFMGILRKRHSGVLMKYLWAVLSSPAYRERLGQESTGNNINNLGAKIGSVPVPLPPLDIQRRVVEEMDRIDARIQALQKDIASCRGRVHAVISRCWDRFPPQKLRTAAAYSTDRVNAASLTADTYVGVDNLLPGIGGKRPSEYVPVSGYLTAYQPGDILLSNIRPYLKKAWTADSAGGASGDVLVLRTDREKAVPEYVFAFLSEDRFFAYEMEHIGSNVKMPRADKKRVLDYQFPLPGLTEQRETSAEIQRQEAEIRRLSEEISEAEREREAVLKKYLQQGKITEKT